MSRIKITQNNEASDKRNENFPNNKQGSDQQSSNFSIKCRHADVCLRLKSLQIHAIYLSRFHKYIKNDKQYVFNLYCILIFLMTPHTKFVKIWPALVKEL